MEMKGKKQPITKTQIHKPNHRPDTACPLTVLQTSNSARVRRCDQTGHMVCFVCLRVTSWHLWFSDKYDMNVRAVACDVFEQGIFENYFSGGKKKPSGFFMLFQMASKGNDLKEHRE